MGVLNKIAGLGSAGILSVLLTPEEVEAISPKELWKIVKPVLQKLGYDRVELSQEAKAVYNTPRKILDAVNDIRVDDEFFKSITPPGEMYAGVSGYKKRNPTEKMLGINPSIPKKAVNTLGHELGHLTNGVAGEFVKPEVLHGDAYTFKRYNNMVNAEANRRGGLLVNIPDMEEYSADVVGRRLARMPVHPDVDPYVDQYIKEKGGHLWGDYKPTKKPFTWKEKETPKAEPYATGDSLSPKDIEVLGLSTKPDKELFETLRNKGGKILYRKEGNVEKLAKEGFSESKQLEESGFNKSVFNEAGGLYTTDNPNNLANLISGGRRKTGEKPNMAMIPLEGSRYKKFSPEEWGKQTGNRLEITKALKKDYDFVEYPDLNTNQPNLYQTVQINPNKSIAKIKVGNKFVYKVLGTAGIGTGLSLIPNDADAMPLGKPLKGLFKTFAEGMKDTTQRLGKEMARTGQKVPFKSSVDKELVGRPLQGSTIAGVYQSSGDSRYIHLADGRIIPTDRDSLHELAAEFGTQKQIRDFVEKNNEAKWDQILRSYYFNEERGTPPRAGGAKPSRIHILENSLVDRQQMLGEGNIADQVLVQSVKSKKWWLWPRVYAEPAEAAGLVRIDRAKKTLFTNKGLRDAESK